MGNKQTEQHKHNQLILDFIATIQSAVQHMPHSHIHKHPFITDGRDCCTSSRSAMAHCFFIQSTQQYFSAESITDRWNSYQQIGAEHV